MTKEKQRRSKKSSSYSKQTSSKKPSSQNQRKTTSYNKNRRVHSKSSYNSSLYNKNLKKKNQRKKEKHKLNLDAVIALLIIGIVSLIFIGWEMSLIIVLGLTLIYLLSVVTDKLITKKSTRKGLNFLVIIFFVIICFIILGTAYGAFKVIKDAPAFNEEKLKRKESTLIYDSNKKLTAELGTEKREIIKFDQLSETVVNAIIATEDSRFFQHQGFDAARFLKASLGQVQGDDNAGGGSTLSMQVIKNSFTSKESRGLEGIKRKFTDIYLAVFKLEKDYTKEEIFEFYVNNHFLGSNSYGVEQAALTYFNKTASELNLSEAAIIAGLFQAPSTYNPFVNPEKTTQRRKLVLSLMRRHGYITKEEEDIANSISVESLLTDKKQADIEFGAYIDTVIEELKKKGIDPYRDSLLIYTNMDRTKQAKLDDVFSGKTFNWVYPHIQSGVAAVENNSGKIIAIGAGRNRSDARTYNYATMIKRQIGSVAKPIFDYGPGMEYNGWSTYTLFNDGPHRYTGGKAIRNSDGAYMGTITLRRALALSRNIPALKAFQQVDNKKIIEFVEGLGITPEIESGRIHEAHSLGAFTGSSPLEMAAAYAAFANGGTYYEPYAVNKIVYRDTNEVVEFSSKGVKAMEDSTAFMITDVLKTSVTSGLASGARVNGVNVAAKTGTTNLSAEELKKLGFPASTANDAWVVGYDPDYSIGMWYGYPDKTHYMTTGQSVPQRARVFQAAGNIIFERTGKDFKVPSSVVKLKIEMGTNPAMLASPSTPSNKIIYEYFRKKDQPEEVSITYNKLSNVTGLAANYDGANKSVILNWNGVSTPADAKEEYGKFGYKVYKNGKFLGFTEHNSFIVKNTSKASGTYKVITSYEIYTNNASSGVSVSLDTISVSFKAGIKNTFNISDSSYNFSEDVIAKRDSSEVSSTANVTIKDLLNNNNVSWDVALGSPGAYLVSYTVYNEGKVIGTLNREVTVVE